MDTDVRHKALAVLNALGKGRTTLDAVMGRILDQDEALAGRDRAFAQTLIYGVLRWRNRLDWIVARFSKTPLQRMDPAVLNLLRLGLFQILYLSKVPVSAAVNTSVEMAKSFSAPWVVRFVNAVLRRAVREHGQVIWPDIDHDPQTALAVTRSLPKWLVAKWLARFGTVQTTNLCDALNEIPPITVRSNTLKTDRTSLIAALQQEAQAVAPTPYAPDGVHFTGPALPVAELSTYRRGWFQAQDEAAQLVGCLLDPQPEEQVLDACAGRGGKTGHLAQLMKNRGRIVALDNDPKKLKLLRSEMKRLGADIVTTRQQNLNGPLDIATHGLFDRILLDAPCSGLGVLRRHPDARWQAAKRNLVPFQRRQLDFLTKLATLVKVGGVVVYAVCSIEPEENEAVVDAFLNSHRLFAVDRSVALPPVVCPDGYMLTLPHRHQMDGFFAVRLKRMA